MTHEHRLQDTAVLIDDFSEQVTYLGHKLGPLLVQLPPSLRFEQAVAEKFFSALRNRFSGFVVCEPRHASWFVPQADDLLSAFQVARVAADPAPVPQASAPGGWNGLRYFRLHGSPTIYRSAYSATYLQALAEIIQKNAEQSAPVWCIFDNTAESAATENALELMKVLRLRPEEA
jgi:uncharacterized protein YecE (DUF72 family)